MSEKRDRRIIGPLSSRSEIADYINYAFKSSDIVAICHAIGDATRLHNVSDIGFSRRTVSFRASPMSESGQSLPKSVVRAMSVLTPLATT
jgi:DNA-binding phage protein